MRIQEPIAGGLVNHKEPLPYDSGVLDLEATEEEFGGAGHARNAPATDESPPATYIDDGPDRASREEAALRMVVQSNLGTGGHPYGTNRLARLAAVMHLDNAAEPTRRCPLRDLWLLGSLASLRLIREAVATSQLDDPAQPRTMTTEEALAWHSTLAGTTVTDDRIEVMTLTALLTTLQESRTARMRYERARLAEAPSSP